MTVTVTDTESPLDPSIPVSGTRKRLDHVDAMRPVKQFGVVSTHTLLFFAPVGTGLSVGGRCSSCTSHARPSCSFRPA
jgi:hypothetical protein